MYDKRFKSRELHTQGSSRLSRVATASPPPALVTTWFWLTLPQTQSLSGGNNISSDPSYPHYLGEWCHFLPNDSTENCPFLPCPWFMSRGEGWACTGWSSASRWSLNNLSSFDASRPGFPGTQNISQFPHGHSTWLRDFFSMLPPAIMLVFLWSDVNFLRFSPLSLKMSVLLSKEEVLNILAKANPVLSCLYGTLCHQLLYSHTWFQKPKKASHQSASPWPLGTCLRPNGQLS